jgi:hypothetical protein
MVRIGKTVLRVTRPTPKLADEPEARATETKSPDDGLKDQKSESLPNGLPQPAGHAPVAAVPQLEPAPKRGRDMTKLVIWAAAGLLAVVSLAALVWIFR